MFSISTIDKFVFHLIAASPLIFLKKWATKIIFVFLLEWRILVPFLGMQTIYFATTKKNETKAYMLRQGNKIAIQGGK